MIKHHKIDADEFLEFVHDVDLSFLKRDKFLEKEIKELEGKKLYLQMGRGLMLKMLQKELE